MPPDGPAHLADRAVRIGVRDEAVLRAVTSIPRAGFVPPGRVDIAYRDEPVPTARGQVTSQPSLIAKMVEALHLTGDEHVLEVGTGYGWQTALLAMLAHRVWSIERFDDIAETAASNLARARVANARVVIGDGTLGLPEFAPYDAIILSAASTSVPPPLVEQLVEGGRLVQPVGPGGSEVVTAFTRRDGVLAEPERIANARFVPLVGHHAQPVHEPGR